MSIVDNVEDFLDSPAGDEWLKNFILKEQAQEKIRRDLISNTDYIDWLISFTNKRGGFDDSQWLYHPEMINADDKAKVEKLELFFDAIKKYCDKNYIYPISIEYGNYYMIKYNGIGFEIGIMVGQGALAFCNRVTIENEDDFVDYNDIMMDKKQANVDNIKTMLGQISDIIKKAYENGTPSEAIICTVDNTIKELSRNNCDSPKKLVRNK